MKSKLLNKISRFFKSNNDDDNVDVVNVADNAEEFELCVMCGKTTGIPISMPVDWRENYEIGCGQLCVECAKKQQKYLQNKPKISQQ